MIIIIIMVIVMIMIMILIIGTCDGGRSDESHEGSRPSRRLIIINIIRIIIIIIIIIIYIYIYMYIHICIYVYALVKGFKAQECVCTHAQSSI